MLHCLVENVYLAYSLVETNVAASAECSGTG